MEKPHLSKDKCGFVAPQKEFESPTFRLGGGRSILLSYWGITLVFYSKKRALSRKRWRNGYFFIFPLYRIGTFGYNKANYANLTK